MNVDLDNSPDEIEEGDRVRFKPDESTWVAIDGHPADDGYVYGEAQKVEHFPESAEFDGAVDIEYDAECCPNDADRYRTVQSIEYSLVEVV